MLLPEFRESKQMMVNHGDLRAALLKSAEEIIRDSGLEGLTLRACARKADVSHGALTRRCVSSPWIVIAFTMSKESS